jgi:hypothetical protein
MKKIISIIILSIILLLPLQLSAEIPDAKLLKYSGRVLLEIVKVYEDLEYVKNNYEPHIGQLKVHEVLVTLNSNLSRLTIATKEDFTPEQFKRPKFLLFALSVLTADKIRKIVNSIKTTQDQLQEIGVTIADYKKGVQELIDKHPNLWNKKKNLKEKKESWFW